MNQETGNPDILLTASGLWRQYDDHVAVRNLDLELKRGEVLGFLGPNGAGKSTTMQMLSGNLAPTAGNVMINGVDLLDDPDTAKRELGYLPENPPLYADMTVSEYLDFCACLHDLRGSTRTQACDRAMERCGLGSVRKRLIANLSKGFQQRVGIAQAVLHEPAVVILDEPTVGLDPIQIRDIRKLIRELGEQHAVILSTHILPEVQEVCDRVLIIHRGQAVYADTLASITSGSMNYRLAGTALPDDATLESIHGISHVKRLQDDVVTFRLSGSVEELLANAVRENWKVRELAPIRNSLEQVFVDLTSRDLADEEDAA